MAGRARNCAVLALLLSILCQADGFGVCPWLRDGLGVHGGSARGAAACSRRARVAMSTARGGRGEEVGQDKLAKLEEEKQALLARMAAIESELQSSAGDLEETVENPVLGLEVEEEDDSVYHRSIGRRAVDPLHRPVFEQLMEETGNVRVFEITELNMTAWHSGQTSKKQGEGKLEDSPEMSKGLSREMSRESRETRDSREKSRESREKARESREMSREPKEMSRRDKAREKDRELSREQGKEDKDKDEDEDEKEERLGSYEGRLGMRHFKYRTRDGDLFVKMMVVDEPDVDFSEEKKDEDAELAALLEMSGLAPKSGAGMDFGLSGDEDFENFDPALMAGLSGMGSFGSGGNSGGGGGGLILNVGPISESLGLKLTGSKEEKLPYPLAMFEGERRSLKAIEETKTIRVPSAVVSGDLRTEEYAKAMIKSQGKKVVLPTGAFLVTEFMDLTTKGALGPTPLLVGNVGEKIAQMHQRSEGFSSRYGFDVDTYVGLERQNNKYREDFVDFFISNRLEPQIQRASKELRSKWGRRKKERQTIDEIEELSWTAVERLSDSYIWNELVFAPAMEDGPRLLHGDLWVGNMGMDGDGKAVVLNPASWYGPAEYDLSVGATFGMPARFFEAYHHHTPPLEDWDMRLKAYKLHHLLVRLNQCEPETKKRPTRSPYKPDNFNGGRTLTSFKTTSVLNPIKHQYRSEMEMLSRGSSEPSSLYLKECIDLLKDIIKEDPPKVGKVFKMWGQNKQTEKKGKWKSSKK